MKILKFLLYTILALVVFVLAAGLFARKDYHIERSWEINAPKSIIFDQLVHYKNFQKWSPWSALDPNMKYTISEPDGKVGSIYTWKGNDKVGEGSMETAAITNDRIDTKVIFKNPWESSMPTFFKMEEKGKAIKVSWGSDMIIPFPMNAFAMFTDVDKAIGTDYETGLRNLKKTCEDLASQRYGGFDVKDADAPVRYFSGIRKVVPFAEMDKFFQENAPKVAELTKKAGGLIQDAIPVAIVFTYDTIGMKSDCVAAVSLKEAKKLGGGVQVFTLGGKKSVSVDFYGNPAESARAHYGLELYMKEKGITPVMPCIEEYLTDMAAEKDPAKWLTRVTYFY
jgi:effector-binding domain-containing protein